MKVPLYREEWVERDNHWFRCLPEARRVGRV
jgi:hypothetical protein